MFAVWIVSCLLCIVVWFVAISGNVFVLRVGCFNGLMFWLLWVYLFVFDCYVICLGLFVLDCFFGVVIVLVVRFLSFICFEFCDRFGFGLV